MSSASENTGYFLELLFFYRTQLLHCRLFCFHRSCVELLKMFLTRSEYDRLVPCKVLCHLLWAYLQLQNFATATPSLTCAFSDYLNLQHFFTIMQRHLEFSQQCVFFSSRYTFTFDVVVFGSLLNLYLNFKTFQYLSNLLMCILPFLPTWWNFILLSIYTALFTVCK